MITESISTNILVSTMMFFFIVVLFRKIIKKGWPGKIDSVLDRQTELVLLSVYGFYEYCAKVSQKERIAIHKDFTNMINLHLQDRLFF